MSEELKSIRKVYKKIDLLDLYHFSVEVPPYLLVFPELIKEEVDNLWYKKPLPKFEEVVEGQHIKSSSTFNKYKGRQRSISNQSGDAINEDETNFKYKHQISKFKTEKYSRFNLNESHNINTSVTKDIVEDNDEDSWMTIPSKSSKMFNLSKQYVSNYQCQENHWKKWGRDRTISEDKSGSLFNRYEKPNNFVVRKFDQGIKYESKIRASHSFSAGTDQTEDIWQDDWDTEMQSQLSTVMIEPLEYYELPPSSSTVRDNVGEKHADIAATLNDMRVHEIDSNLWFYKDLLGQIQGPFSSESMANWLATGYFDYATSLRRKCDEKFLLLAEYRALYGRIPFTKGPTISAILSDTNVNIDSNQLVVGVDRSILQKVLANATSLSSKMSPFVNAKQNMITSGINIDAAITNEADKQSIIEEKRKLEECKAELERERKRILDEQEQWKIRMQNEMESRIQSLREQQTIEHCHTNCHKLEPIKEPFYKPELAEVSIKSDTIIDHDDLKNQNLKSPNMFDKNFHKRIQIPIQVVEEIPTENSSKLCKGDQDLIIMCNDESKQQIETVDETQNHSLWSIKSTVLNLEQPKISKSLLEIQAEEIQKEKIKQELVKFNNPIIVKDNKITSFKDSLLKNVTVVKASPIQCGKSIFDVTRPMDSSIPVGQVEKPVEPKVLTRIIKKQADSNNHNKDDDILNWCTVQLSKFRNDLDVLTVVELLKEVPNENVVELTVELLGDSVFSKNFAKDFIKRRDDFKMTLLKEEDAWQTVKRSQSGLPIFKKTTATSRKTKKKKMVVVDHIKSVS